MEPQANVASLPARRRPIPQTGARALILFNEKAGSVCAGDRDKLIEAVRAAGISAYKLLGPEKISRRLLEQARHVDVVIVLGGDGTARAVAELAPRDGPPLLLLPGGTLNILPRALYGDRSWQEALLAALERGVVRRLTAGRANGKWFYVAALFGAPTLLARAREAVREGRPIAAWRRFRHFLGRSFARRLRARPDREPARKAEAIGVLCPSFAGDIEARRLEWVHLDARHLLDLARLGLRAGSRAWRDDPAVEIGQCRTGDILSLGLIHATLDGEPHTFVSRVRVVHELRGPRVIALEEEDAA